MYTLWSIMQIWYHKHAPWRFIISLNFQAATKMSLFLAQIPITKNVVCIYRIFWGSRSLRKIVILRGNVNTSSLELSRPSHNSTHEFPSANLDFCGRRDEETFRTTKNASTNQIVLFSPHLESLNVPSSEIIQFCILRKLKHESRTIYLLYN